MRFGMMQGRLLPSKDGRLQSFPGPLWRQEFHLAPGARIDFLEWVFDQQDEAVNPLGTPEGQAAIRAEARATGIPVASICAHWFVESPLLGAPAAKALDKLRWLCDCAQAIGAGRIVLPLEALPDLDPRERTREALSWIPRLALLEGPVLALECACPPPELARLVEALGGTRILLNYDIGNSTGLGLSVVEELDIIGDRLGAVHLKDKVRGGASVPLGKGHADFSALGRWLKAHGYQGDLVFEAMRGPVGEEVPWTLAMRAFADAFLDGALGS